MKRLSATLLALGLAAAVGTASAQTYGGYSNSGSSNPGYSNQSNAIYDWARVVRVDPVIDSRYSSGYGNNGYANNGYVNNNSGNRCYTSGGSYPTNGGYNNGNYASNDPYYPQQGRYGTDTGRTVATVVGGLAGALLGSKVGGGSGQVAAAAIGSMVGGLAGRQVYEGTQRRKYERSSVTVCDDQYGNNNAGYNGNNNYANNDYGSYNAGNDGRVVGYDVTYEYAGRQFRTRTDHHPGDRIRVRVDVNPEQ
ncbi:glycine zipper 2TM domain-containing protein [Lysobacter sp. 2RAF19]